MAAHPDLHLSRRERQIMDIVFGRGEVTVGDVHGALADPPSYSSVRAQMRILEEKGWLRHRQDGPRYVYLAEASRSQLGGRALGQIMRSFFAGVHER